MTETTRTPTPDDLADDLAAAMQQFWEHVAELEPAEWETAAVAPGWTPKAVVAHVAFWDDYQRRRMEAALAGKSRGGFPRPTTDNDARAAADAGRTWEEVVAAAVTAREQLVAFARSVPPAALTATYPEGERQLSVVERLRHMARHVREHGAGLHAYCGSMARWSRPRLRACWRSSTPTCWTRARDWTRRPCWRRRSAACGASVMCWRTWRVGTSCART